MAENKQKKGANVIMTLNEQHKMREQKDQSFTRFKILIAITEKYMEDTHPEIANGLKSVDVREQSSYNNDQFMNAWNSINI
jgi:hypothetical protein